MRNTNPTEDDSELPTIHTTTEPLEEEKTIQLYAEMLRENKATIPLQSVEHYMTIRPDSAKARNFLLTLLEADHDSILPDPGGRPCESEKVLPMTEEEKRSSLTMSNDELEEYFELNWLMKAVEQLHGDAQAPVKPTH